MRFAFDFLFLSAAFHPFACVPFTDMDEPFLPQSASSSRKYLTIGLGLAFGGFSAAVSGGAFCVSLAVCVLCFHADFRCHLATTPNPARSPLLTQFCWHAEPPTMIPP